jgi:hypothetical protein
LKIYGQPFGGDMRVIWDLVPGNYVALTQDGSAVQEFTVVEGGAPAEVAAEIPVALADFAFFFPVVIPAGPHTWELTNIGEQWHELVVVKLNEGVTVEDVFAFFETAGPDDAPPMELVMGYAPFSEGNRVWLDVDLPAGEYTVICFLPDIAGDMAPHAVHGMVRTMVVK